MILYDMIVFFLCCRAVLLWRDDEKYFLFFIFMIFYAVGAVFNICFMCCRLLSYVKSPDMLCPVGVILYPIEEQLCTSTVQYNVSSF